MKQIKWNTSRGEAVVTVSLVTEKTINADGDMVKVSCCDLTIRATIAGQHVGDYITRKAQTVQGVQLAGNIGKLAVRVEHMTLIDAAIAEIKATPEWQAKEAAIAANAKTGEEYNQHRAMMARVMGY